jgi:hypothetical protein
MRLNGEYLAGFIDGEGCIDFCRARNKGKLSITPRLRIIQCGGEAGKLLMQAIQYTFGGSLNYRPKAYANEWTVTGYECFKVLNRVKNSLILKWSQAELAIWWYENIRKGLNDEGLKNTAINAIAGMKKDQLKASEDFIDKIRQVKESGQGQLLI